MSRSRQRDAYSEGYTDDSESDRQRSSRHRGRSREKSPMYRSTVHIYVPPNPSNSVGETDTIPVGYGSKKDLVDHATNTTTDLGKLSKPKKSGLRNMIEHTKRRMSQLNYEHHALPENPGFSQRLRYALLCPPHDSLGEVLTMFVFFLFVWITAWSLFKGDALPGGGVFALLVMIGAAYLGGILVSFIRLPPLLGMLIVGFMLRNVPGINIATDINPVLSRTLRNIALTVILTRAGLGLDGAALRKLSKSVLLLAFLPCLMETLTVGVAAYVIMGFPWLWGFLLGFVQAAVSPAVLVPFMLNLQETKLGTNKGIPTLLIAASSLDDVVAISGFSVLLSVIFSTGGSLWYQIIQAPLELLIGLIYGVIVGVILWYLPHRKYEALSIFRLVFLLCAGLIAVFGSKAIGFGGAGALGCLITAFVAAHRWKQPGWNLELVKPALSFGNLWKVFQPLLFGLIGAQVGLERIQLETVGLAIAVLCCGLVVRMAFTMVAVSGSGLNLKEKFFSAIAWIPKATVQAALGSLALDAAKEMKAAPEIIVLGEKVVTIAVLLIIITAPLGAIAIGLTAPLLLEKEDGQEDQLPDGNPEEKKPMVGHH